MAVRASGTGSRGTQADRGSRWRHGRLRRWAAIALAVVLVLAIAAVAVASWYFSSVLLDPRHGDGPYDLEVVGAQPGRVVLPRDGDTLRPGTYGLDWEGGHAIVERVIGTDADSVTRRVRAVRGHLEAGTHVALDPQVYEGDPRAAIGIPFDDVRVQGDLGAMPAWRVDGGDRVWAIFVHGIDGNRGAALRILPTLEQAGLTSLAITYRNDVGAPRSPDGKHHLGLTEWRDLEAAARYALGHGAERLVVIGYSMGGAIVTQFMERSPLADRVAGLV